MVGEIEDDEDDYDVPLTDEEMDDFENDGDDVDLDDDDIDINPRERAARALEIRRALEARDEERRLSEDLDYLDFDDD